MAWHLVSLHRAVLCSAGSFLGAVSERVDAVPAGDDAAGNSVKCPLQSKHAEQ